MKKNLPDLFVLSCALSAIPLFGYLTLAVLPCLAWWYFVKIAFTKTAIRFFAFGAGIVGVSYYLISATSFRHDLGPIVVIFLGLCVIVIGGIGFVIDHVIRKKNPTDGTINPS